MQSPIRVLYLFFLFLILAQNLLASIMSIYSYEVARIILGMKELVLFLVVFIHFCYMLFSGRFDKFSLVLYGLILLVIFLPFIHGYFVLLSVRQLLLIPLLLLLGYVLAKFLSFESVFRPFIYMGWFVLFTAYIEYFLHTDKESFLIWIGVPDFMKMKGFDLWAFGPFGLPGNFYSFDLYPFLGTTVRRAVSILLEPTLLGQFLTLFSFYYFLKKNYFKAMLFLGGILLALSKGGVFTLFVAFFLYIYSYRFSAFLRVFSIMFIAGIAFFAYEVMVYLQVQSVINHVFGFVDNFINLFTSPFGNGIGGAGNYAGLESRVSGDNKEILAGESFLGTAVGQLGVIALFAYLALFYKLSKVYAINTPILAIKIIGLATLISGVFSESAISFIGSGVLIVLIGFIFEKKYQPLSACEVDNKKLVGLLIDAKKI